MPRSPLLVPTLLFATLIALVSAVGMVGDRSLRALADDSGRVNHSYEVLSRLDAAVEAAIGTENASRGFRLTGEPAFLVEYRAARDRARDSAHKLSALVADNPPQRARADALGQAIEDKIAFLEVVHGLVLGRSLPDSVRSVGRDAALLEAVAGRARAFRAEEARLLGERTEQAQATYRRARLALLAVLVAALALAALVYFQFARAVIRQAEAAEVEHARARELAETDRRKDEFLAILGHELRNPLAPIQMALHVLDTDGAPVQTVARAREILSDQVRLMTRIVEDVMDASRITLGKVRLEPESVDLAELMRSVADGARPAIEERQHHLEVHPPPARTMVSLDPRRARQILHNLLVNASKFTDPGGHITFTGTADARTVTLRVLDDGLGLTAPQIAHIFQPFAQAENARPHVDGGLGIGLALARNLVELHGGSIEAASPGPGRGSCFTIRLPRAAF